MIGAFVGTPIGGVIRARAEATAVDKWFAPLQTPQANFRARITATAGVTIQAGAIIGLRPNFDPTAQIGWQAPLSEPRAFLERKRLNTASQQALAYVKTIDKENVNFEWAPPLSEPSAFLRRRALATHSQQHFAWLRTIEADNVNLTWFNPLNEPPKPRVSIRTAAQQHFTFGPRYDFDDAAQIGWFAPLSEPTALLRRRGLGTESQQHFAFVRQIDSENVYLEWAPPLSEPPHFKIRRGLAAASQKAHFWVHPNSFPEEALMSKWYPPLQEPPHFKIRRGLPPGLQQFFVYAFPSYDAALISLYLHGRNQPNISLAANHAETIQLHGRNNLSPALPGKYAGTDQLHGKNRGTENI